MPRAKSGPSTPSGESGEKQWTGAEWRNAAGGAGAAADSAACTPSMSCDPEVQVLHGPWQEEPESLGNCVVARRRGEEAGGSSPDPRNTNCMRLRRLGELARYSEARYLSGEAHE